MYRFAVRLEVDPMRITELNHVALHVADVERSKRFYERVLGLAQITRPAFDFPGAWYGLGTDQELHLIGGRKAEILTGPRGTHFALTVDSIEEAKAQLDQSGWEFRGPKARPDGAMQIFLADPDGHVIEVSALAEV